MSQIPKPQEIYKHFKGNLYQITAIATHTETGEQLVIYQAMYGDFKIYARPLSMFMEKVDREKYPQVSQEYRFELHENLYDDTESRKSEVVKTEEITLTKEEALTEEVMHIDPMIMEFLEADSYEKKLNILTGLRHRITHDMINTMALASDLEVAEGELEERFQGLKQCLLMLQKYESSRLR